jgi:hypothetical protein
MQWFSSARFADASPEFRCLRCPDITPSSTVLRTLPLWRTRLFSLRAEPLLAATGRLFWSCGRLFILAQMSSDALRSDCRDSPPVKTEETSESIIEGCGQEVAAEYLISHRSINQYWAGSDKIRNSNTRRFEEGHLVGFRGVELYPSVSMTRLPAQSVVARSRLAVRSVGFARFPPAH